MAEKRVQLAAILTRRSGRLAIAAMALAVLVGCSSPTTIEGSYWKWPHVGSNAVAMPLRVWCPWKDRLKLFHSSLQEFKPRLKYDMIVTNPPFYPDHLKSPHATRSGAKHQDWMSFSDLIPFAGNHLQPDGSLWILSPPSAQNDLQWQARSESLYLTLELEIRHSLDSEIFRYVSRYSRSQGSAGPIKDQLMIRSADNSYSVEMTRLLEPYYLEYNFI